MTADTKKLVDVVAGKQKAALSPADTSFDAIPSQAGDISYVLTATNAAGSVTQTEKATVTGFAFDFTVDPTSITPGQTVTLKWSAPGAKSIQIDKFGSVPFKGSPMTNNPTATTDYVISVAGRDGFVSQKKVTVTVGLGAAKVDFFTAAPLTINMGDKATLTFSVQNAKHVTIQGSNGNTLIDRDVTTPQLPEQRGRLADRYDHVHPDGNQRQRSNRFAGGGHGGATDSYASSHALPRGGSRR